MDSNKKLKLLIGIIVEKKKFLSNTENFSQAINCLDKNFNKIRLEKISMLQDIIDEYNYKTDVIPNDRI